MLSRDEIAMINMITRDKQDKQKAEKGKRAQIGGKAKQTCDPP